MNGLTNDLIAIDTNVFLHLLHWGDDEDAQTINRDGHIDELLDRLRADKIALLVDDKNSISAEYREYIHPLMTKDETDTKRYLLSYWMQVQVTEVALDYKSQLY